MKRKKRVSPMRGGRRRLGGKGLSWGVTRGSYRGGKKLAPDKARPANEHHKRLSPQRANTILERRGKRQVKRRGLGGGGKKRAKRINRKPTHGKRVVLAGGEKGTS